MGANHFLSWRRRLLMLRTLVVSALLLGLLALAGQRSAPLPPGEAILWLALLASPSLLYPPTAKAGELTQGRLLALELLLDMCLFLALAAQLGGAANPVTFYLLVPVLVAALALAAPASASLTAVAVLGYGLTLYWHRIPAHHSQLHALSHDLNALHGQGMWVAFSLVACVMTVLGQALQQSQRRQRRQEAHALTLALQRERMYQLAGTMADRAHEMNTPLTTLMLTLERLPDDAATLDATTIASLRELVRRLTTALRSRPASVPAEGAIRLDDLVSEVAHALRLLAPTLRVKGPEESDPALTPPDAWYRILVNLGYNACDAGAQELKVEASVEDGELHLQVSDDGPRHRGGLREGLGVGLALVETTLATLGGSLDFRTTTHWTQVVIRCPVGKAAAA